MSVNLKKWILSFWQCSLHATLQNGKKLVCTITLGFGSRVESGRYAGRDRALDAAVVLATEDLEEASVAPVGVPRIGH